MNKVAVTIAIIVLVILLLGDQNISPFLPGPPWSGWWNWGYRADGSVGSLPVGWYIPTRYPFWYPYYW